MNFLGLNFLVELFWKLCFNISFLAENETIVGARSTADLVEARRKYDFSDEIIWKEKTHAPFLTILNRRLQKYSVTDPEPKIMQDGYTKVVFTLNNDAGTATEFEFTNNHGALLQTDDILMVFTTNDYSTALAEYARVVSVGDDDSGPAGAGFRSVIVSRAYEGGAAIDIDTAANFRLVHAGLTYSEGDGIGESRNVEVETVQNFTEIIKEAYEVTGTFNATDYYGPVDMQYKARKARKDFFRKFEYKLLFGRKFKKTVSNKPRRYTGGLHEHVKGTDGDSFIDFVNSATATTWNTKMETVFTVGSESKLCLAGPGLMTLLDNAFTGTAYNYTKNEQLSRNYLIRVKTLELSHGSLNVVREQALAELPSYTKTGFILDLMYLQYMYMKGRDVQILKNVQNNDKDTEKNAIFAEIGLHRAFGGDEGTHFWIYNLD